MWSFVYGDHLKAHELTWRIGSLGRLVFEALTVVVVVVVVAFEVALVELQAEELAVALSCLGVVLANWC